MKRRAFFVIALLLALGNAAHAQIPQPVITSISPTQTTAGAPSFTLSVSGSAFLTDGRSRVRWGGELLPTNYINDRLLHATVDSSFISSPGSAQIDVINGGQLPSAAKLTFTVNPPPVISSAAPPRAVIGVPYSHQFVATGGTLPLTWSFTGALPDGLTFSSGGLLSRTPTKEGSFTFTVGLRDSAGVAAQTVDFTLVVGPPPLTITTASPLPNGAVGVAYSQPLTAAGGVPPYSNWQLVRSQLPPGLALEGSTIKGTPQEARSYGFQVAVNDSAGETAFKDFTLIINPAPLTITTASPLPGATVGVPYSQTFAATGGTPPYITWTIISGSLPLGMSFSPRDASLSGTPTQSRTDPFTFTIAVTDSARITATKLFSLTVSPAAPVITTASPLPNGTVGLLYSLNFAATGGTTPYTWIASTGLPPGLTLGSTGLLSGTPTTPGTYAFTVTVNGLTSKQFTLTVVVPAAPAISVTGLTDTVNPAQQFSFDVQLSAPYSLPITGTITLTFTPDAVVPSDDPSIQFSAGGRTMNFNIPAGQTRAFPTAPPAIQTGTVAGRIDLPLKFSAGGQDITPTPAPTRSVQIARSAPRIVSLQIANRTSTGFNVLVTGYSTPRQVTQAVFSFTAASGANLQTTQLTVPVDTAFTTWYGGASSTQFGSSFLYTQPFTVQGNTTAIASVSVTLVNSTGSSQPVSATF